MITKKRKIEILEAAWEANKISLLSLGEKVALMNGSKYFGGHSNLKKSFASIDLQWKEEIDKWKNFRDSLTDEEVDFTLSSLPHFTSK